jgi:glycosyltransferase involved in cell wall biosynthesis/tetratricopeptide (TPR) repeat protein
MKQPLVSLIIPCYNESKRINLLLSGIEEFIKNWKESFEIIIVDDGSSDNTYEALKKEPLLDNSAIHIIQLEKNAGKAAALKKGIMKATSEYVLTLDADMSARPIQLQNWKKLNTEIFKKNEIWIGCRVHEKSEIEALTLRRNTGALFNKIVQLLTPLQVSDSQCGFKLYPAAAAKEIFSSLYTHGWAHDVEVLFKAHNNGIAINEMPIKWKNEDHSKLNVWLDGFKMFIQVFVISFLVRITETFINPFKSAHLHNEKYGKYFRLAFWLIALATLFIMPKLSFDYGVTGDEHWHHDYGNAIYHYFADGDKSMLDWHRVEQSKKFEESGIHYYGGLFDVWVALWNKKVGCWGDYEMMHFWCAIVGAIGFVFCGLLAAEFGGWLGGIIALLMIIFSPSYMGQCFNNPKDIPFATATVWAIYQLIKFIKQLPKPSFKTSLLLSLAIGAALGVRIGGVLLIFYAFVFVIIALMANEKLRPYLNKTILIKLFIISLGGYIIGLIAWPYGHSSPIANPLETIGIMSNFFTQLPMLYNGERIMNDEVPWNYIPTWISITAPIYFLIGIIGFLVIAFINRKKMNFVLIGLVAFAILFPWLVAVKKGSALYDGWRHFLFTYPLLIALAAIFWHSIIIKMKGFLKLVPVGILAALMCLPLKFSIANHPNEYLYFNEYFGGIKNAYGNFETDYYMNSAKQAFNWLAKNELDKLKDTVSIRTNCVDAVSYYRLQYLTPDKAVHFDTKNGPPLDYGLTFKNKNVYVGYINYKNRSGMDDWDYGIFYSRFIEKELLEIPGYYPPTNAIHVVKVDNVPIMCVLKRNSKLEKKYILLADTLVKQNKMDSALVFCNKTLSLNPINRKAIQQLVQITFKLNTWDNLISSCKSAISNDPINDEYYYYLGLAFANQNKKAEAKAALQSAMQINPNQQQAYQLYKQLGF